MVCGSIFEVRNRVGRVNIADGRVGMEIEKSLD
jgi:hypothetical protein